MKTAVLITLSFVAAALSMPSFAHDPKEHQKQGASAPDCSKLKGMDMSKMDMNDPVMKALHAKCKKQMDHEKVEHDHTKSAPGADRKAGAAQKPGVTTIDCSKMKGMDMSKMDMNDPAMKAMHDKCMKQMQHDPKPDDTAPKSGSGQKPVPKSNNENTK